MFCNVTDLGRKEIISVTDGTKLGQVCDVELDTCSGRIISLVVYGQNRLFGLLGRNQDAKIAWEEIKIIGDDTILVNCDLAGKMPGKRRNFWHEKK
jgi:YlmC/YmxH family sporulation protein